MSFNIKPLNNQGFFAAAMSAVCVTKTDDLINSLL